MNRHQVAVLCVMLLWWVFAFAQDGTRLNPITVEAEGVAPWQGAREIAIREATRNALQQAIESACGVRLARFEVGRDGVLQREAQLAFAQGIVLRWQRLGEPRIANGCLYMRVRAEVVPVDQLQIAADWREVWQTVGHPPLTLNLRYLGEPAVEPHARSALKTALLEALREMGVRLSTQADANCWQLIAEIQADPIKRWGDADAPYGLGHLFASWHARLTLQVAPPKSRSTVLLIQREAKAISYTSDREAVARAVRKAVMEPDTHWRITLATLWIDQILGLSDTGRQNTQRADTPKPKEAKDHAKNDARKPASANGKRTVQRADRR
jgi:hypothetical protein